MIRSILVLLAVALTAPACANGEPSTRITILVDAFGGRPDVHKDWGYSALIEHDGKRILFDTGNDSSLFRHNAEILGVELSNLDFAVISHRHGDHTDGLRYLLDVNPELKIYVPNDEYFGGPTPQAFFKRSVDSLPRRMRYFDGQVPDPIPHGSPWQHSNFERVANELEIFPGIRVVANLSQGTTFRETPELSLVIDTEDGQILIVGCAHPGIEQILDSIDAKTRPVRLLVGGLHWVSHADGEVERLSHSLNEEWQVQQVAPGHCTGELGFSLLSQIFGRRYAYAGVGSVLEI